MFDVVAAQVVKPESAERLAVRIRTTLDPVEASRKLAAPDWLGPEDLAAPGYRRFMSDLAFPLFTSPRTLLFRKALIVDLGPVTALADGSAAVEIAWRSATLAPLFPVFSGQLLIGTDGLALDGAYAPPFGEFGRLIDRAALHQVAMRTARWFIEMVASQLGASHHHRPGGAFAASD